MSSIRPGCTEMTLGVKATASPASNVFVFHLFFFFFGARTGLAFKQFELPAEPPPIEKSNEAHARIFNDNFSKRASMGFGVRQKTNICTEVSAALKLTST